MRNLIAILSMFICSYVSAANVTIVDFSKTYEHHYMNCDIYFHNGVEGYLYANCNGYAAPFMTYQRSDWSSQVYDEIGVNGVRWNRCALAGDPLFEIRFECNIPLVLKPRNYNIFGQVVQPMFMMEEVVYDPYR
jgi:hypothetical protein